MSGDHLSSPRGESERPSGISLAGEEAFLEYCIGLGVLAPFPVECTRCMEDDVPLSELLVYVVACAGVLLSCALLGGR